MGHCTSCSAYVPYSTFVRQLREDVSRSVLLLGVKLDDGFVGSSVHEEQGVCM